MSLKGMWLLDTPDRLLPVRMKGMVLEGEECVLAWVKVDYVVLPVVEADEEAAVLELARLVS